MHFEVGIGPQLLSYVFLNEIMDHPYSNGGPESNRIGCTKICEGCTNIPKCFPRWGSTLNHFLMGSKIKSWTIHVQMGVPKTIESDIPNLIISNFVKDVPTVPKCVPRWGSAPNHFLMSC